MNSWLERGFVGIRQRRVKVGNFQIRCDILETSFIYLSMITVSRRINWEEVSTNF